MSGKPYDESQLRKYPIKLSSIPKLMFDDPQVDSYIASNVCMHYAEELNSLQINI